MNREKEQRERVVGMKNRREDKDGRTQLEREEISKLERKLFLFY